MRTSTFAEICCFEKSYECFVLYLYSGGRGSAIVPLASLEVTPNLAETIFSSYRVIETITRDTSLISQHASLRRTARRTLSEGRKQQKCKIITWRFNAVPFLWGFTFSLFRWAWETTVTLRCMCSAALGASAPTEGVEGRGRIDSSPTPCFLCSACLTKTANEPKYWQMVKTPPVIQPSVYIWTVNVIHSHSSTIVEISARPAS